jgi:hypothetical protein
MRRLFLVVLLLALAGTAGAIDIKGKWGLGVGTGSFLGSGAEASLIRGKTERTAWILDLSVYQYYSDSRIDSTRQLDKIQRTVNISAGPCFRRFTRPQAKLSPYWDVFLHYNFKSNVSKYEGSYSTGGEGGLAGGLEYFTPWHFTLAAHTKIFSVSMSRNWTRAGGVESIVSHGWDEMARFTLSPQLQLRVYF